MKRVLMLTTPTCIKCKSMIPMLEEISVEYGIDVEIVNALDGKHTELIKEYNIKTVPYIFIYEDDVVKHAYNGDFTKKELINLLT